MSKPKAAHSKNQSIFIEELVSRTARSLGKSQSWANIVENKLNANKITVGDIYLESPAKINSKLKMPEGISKLHKETLITMKDILVKVVDDATLYQTGKDPIIITVPHGGTTGHFLSDRTIKNTRCQAMFNTIADTKTNRISQHILEGFDKMGVKPYRIMAKMFHRSQVDANRNLACAIPTNGVLNKAIYMNYHEKINKAIKELKKKGHSKILLLDVHGHNLTGKTEWLYIGSNWGLSLSKNNWPNFQTKVIKNLKTKINDNDKIPSKVHYLKPPSHYNPNSKNCVATQKYAGGHTIQIYGQKKDISAIQLEFGQDIRLKSKLSKSIGQMVGEIFGLYYKNIIKT